MRKIPALKTAASLVVLMVLGSSLTVLSQQGGLGVFRTRTMVTVLQQRPSKPKDAPIDVLGSAPERKHEDVCIISAKGGQTVFNAKASGDLIEKMKVDARKCGADAIIIRQAEDRTWKPSEGITQAQSMVLAIRYLEQK